MNELRNFQHRNRNQPHGNTPVLDFEKASVEIIRRLQIKLGVGTVQQLEVHDIREQRGIPR